MSKKELIKELVKFPHLQNWSDTLQKYTVKKLLQILAIAKAQNHNDYELDPTDINYTSYYI